jgi:hypothetical protein
MACCERSKKRAKWSDFLIMIQGCFVNFAGQGLNAAFLILLVCLESYVASNLLYFLYHRIEFDLTNGVLMIF